jgi:hypothetical protein
MPVADDAVFCASKIAFPYSGFRFWQVFLAALGQSQEFGQRGIPILSTARCGLYDGSWRRIASVAGSGYNCDEGA